MEIMNPRHFHLMRRHSCGKFQYSIGSEISPLTLLCTDKPIKAFIRGEVYSLPPTKYKPAVDGKLMIQRSMCKAELNIRTRYNRHNPDATQLNVEGGSIRKLINSDEPMYHAIPRSENLQRINRGESAYRVHEHIQKYMPSHRSKLLEVTTSCTTYVRSVFVTNELGEHYEVSLSKFGYYIIRPAKYDKMLCRPMSIGTDTHLFKSMHYEGVLSWFLGMYYERTENVVRKGITHDRELYANREGSPELMGSIDSIGNDDLYNISRWICTKLVVKDMEYVHKYGVDLIETVNKLLVDNIHQEEINRCCLGTLD